MRLLGIDYGTKKVGIALSDESGTVAFPKQVLPNDRNLLSVVKELCGEEQVEGIVIGESKNFHGEPNKVMEEISRFKKEIEESMSLPVYFESEFLTSAGAGSAGAGDTMRDARAAALILQRFLDKQRHK